MAAAAAATAASGGGSGGGGGRRRVVWVAAAVVAVLLVAAAVVVGCWFGLAPRAVDCVPDDKWSAWSACSAACAGPDGSGGVQVATRGVAVMPQNGGRPCAAADLVATQSCNTQVPCGLPCVPNPDPDSVPWANACPACVPSGVDAVFQWRYVPPLSEAGPGGAPCSLSDVFNFRPCPATTSCPPNVDCVIDTASAASVSACSAPCGDGVQYVWHSVTTLPSGSGAGCDWNLLLTQRACNNGACPAATACDTVTWSAPWSECSVPCAAQSGWKYQTRAPSGPLDTCPLVRSVSCAGPLPCPSPPSPDGCTPPSWEYLQALCYLQCAGVTNAAAAAAAAGGAASGVCTISDAELAAVCAAPAAGFPSGECAPPTDCALSPWSAWSACSQPTCDAAVPAGGVAVAARTITAYETAGGVPCDAFPLTAQLPCNAMVPVPYASVSADGRGWVPSVAPPACVPVDCVLAPWATAVPCNAACGVGVEVQTTSVVTPASGGGTCPTDAAAYYREVPCTLSDCLSCTFESDADFIARCNLPGANCWTPCSLPCDGKQYGQKNVVAPAPPGGWCSLSDGTMEQDCCTNCACAIDGCPAPGGAGSSPCGAAAGWGTCTTISGGGGASGAPPSYACVCTEGYFGADCGTRCPLGPLGTPCSGVGTCGADGSCSCPLGFSGAACQDGGACVLYADVAFTDPVTHALTADRTVMGCVDLAALPPSSLPPQPTYGPPITQFSADHCLLLAAVTPTFGVPAVRYAAPAAPGSGSSGTVLTPLAPTTAAGGAWTAELWGALSSVSCAALGAFVAPTATCADGAPPFDAELAASVLSQYSSPDGVFFGRAYIDPSAYNGFQGGAASGPAAYGACSTLAAPIVGSPLFGQPLCPPPSGAALCASGAIPAVGSRTNSALQACWPLTWTDSERTGHFLVAYIGDTTWPLYLTDLTNAPGGTTVLPPWPPMSLLQSCTLGGGAADGSVQLPLYDARSGAWSCATLEPPNTVPPDGCAVIVGTASPVLIGNTGQSALGTLMTRNTATGALADIPLPPLS